jgi:cystathionine beta-lyase/cystathionine gamma-synthase
MLAQQLVGDARIAQVYYPSLPGQDPRGLLGTQMDGSGSVLSFELARDDAATLRAFVTALRLITPAVSLGSTDTLIQPPALLTHRVVKEDARRAAGIAGGLLRLSVGLEDARDLWRDLEHALQVVDAR